MLGEDCTLPMIITATVKWRTMFKQVFLILRQVSGDVKVPCVGHMWWWLFEFDSLEI